MKILAAIPLYNKEHTIVRAVTSVLQQQVQVDVLIINDGCTDKSISLLTPLITDHVTVINQENSGVSVARNAGIAYAIANNYTHIAFLDADDYWKTNHISNLLFLIDRYAGVKAFAGNYEIKQFKFKPRAATFSNLENTNPGVLNDFFKHNYLNSILNASNCCFNLNIFKIIGVFNTAYSHGEDTDLFIRTGIHARVAFHTEVSVSIDKTATNRSALIPMNNRKMIDLDIYDAYANTVVGLKKYLDLNRFSISLAYRMENDIKNAAIFKQKLDPDNLSDTQNKLLEMGTTQLKALKKTKNILGKLGWHLRSAN